MLPATATAPLASKPLKRKAYCPNKTDAVNMIGVESWAFAISSAPPPDTVAVFSCGSVALFATFTVTVIGGQLAPGPRASLRVATGPPGKDQPAPGPAVMETSVSPEGSVSLTCTGPAVAAFP